MSKLNSCNDFFLSLKQKVKDLSKDEKRFYNEMWHQLALERFLAKLSRSKHQEKLIDNWNSSVDDNDNDEVFHLGDFCFYKDHRQVSKLVNRLKGKKHLILGNHDEQFKAKSWVNAGFFSVHTSYYLNHNGQKVWLAHYPEQKSHLQLNNVIYIHGHCHQNVPAIYMDDNSEAIVNVSVEHWNYTPVEISDLWEKLVTFLSMSRGEGVL